VRKLFEKCRRRRNGFLAAIREAEPRYRQLSRFTAIAMHLDSHAPCEGIALGSQASETSLGVVEQLLPCSGSPGCHALRSSVDFVRSCTDRRAICLLRAGDVGRRDSDAVARQHDTEARMIWEDFAVQNIDEEQVHIRLRIRQILALRATRWNFGASAGCPHQVHLIKL
jgi:hypothetical protein